VQWGKTIDGSSGLVRPQASAMPTVCQYREASSGIVCGAPHRGEFLGGLEPDDGKVSRTVLGEGDRDVSDLRGVERLVTLG